MQFVWLGTPYLSMLIICRWGRIARGVAGHTALTLPLGWAAVAALLAALLGVWSPPLGVMVACAALSGLAVITPPRRPPGDDGPGPGDDDDDPPPPPPPLIDWDAFDIARRGWEGDRRRSRDAAGRP